MYCIEPANHGIVLKPSKEVIFVCATLAPVVMLPILTCFASVFSCGNGSEIDCQLYSLTYLSSCVIPAMCLGLLSPSSTWYSWSLSPHTPPWWPVLSRWAYVAGF